MSSIDAIKDLQPAGLWQRFYELTQIPRPSKKEEKVTAHLEALFQSRGLKYTKDKAGNLVARVPATKGYSKAPITVLQGHSDMVCEKNRGTEHDFDRDPIFLLRDGEWIKARGTTLGADNGIGVAAALAVLSDPGVVHGPLEILVTIDEETGLTGANLLSNKVLRGKYLLNLDSEEDGIFYIGCAGGVDTVGTFPIQTSPAPAGEAFTLRIGGLKGGHSGGDIHLGRGNAVKLLVRTLQALQTLKPAVAHIEGGSKRNAIPREAEALIVLAPEAVERAQNIVSQCERAFQNEFKTADGGVKIQLEKTARPATVYNNRLTQKLIQTLIALPHGIIQMSADIEGLVETSTNLATVSTEGNQLRIGTSQRSSVDSAKAAIAAQVGAVLRLGGAKVSRSDGYPGWQPDTGSALLQICKQAALEQTGREPEVKAIHAGLECGILGGKYPHLDMISFGPTITGAHSPDERVHIPAVEVFYDLLKRILKAIAEQKG